MAAQFLVAEEAQTHPVERICTFYSGLWPTVASPAVGRWFRAIILTTSNCFSQLGAPTWNDVRSADPRPMHSYGPSRVKRRVIVCLISK